MHIGSQGDPSLYGDLVRLVREIRKIKKVNAISMVTNGILITRTMADKLINAGMTHFHFSIHSLDEKKADYPDHQCRCQQQQKFEILVLLRGKIARRHLGKHEPVGRTFLLAVQVIEEIRIAVEVPIPEEMSRFALSRPAERCYNTTFVQVEIF